MILVLYVSRNILPPRLSNALIFSSEIAGFDPMPGGFNELTIKALISVASLL